MKLKEKSFTNVLRLFRFSFISMCYSVNVYSISLRSRTRFTRWEAWSLSGH